jgi:hypothetical protein
MRIVELPIPLCPPGQLALAVLIHRAEAMAVGHTIWLGDDYDFDGDTPPETYNLLASHNRFAQHGMVVADYPADTFALDFDIGLTVLLNGADTALDLPTAGNGLSDELLVFAGNEILAVLGATLLAAGVYRLQLGRGRFGTEISAHATGEEVFIVNQSDLLPLTHNSFDPGATVTLKVPTIFQRFKQDLADIEAVEYEIVGTAFNVSPSNLRVNGEHRNATFVATTDVRIDWSLPELRGEIATNFGRRVRTLVEIVSLADEVLYSKLTSAHFFKIAGAKMDTIRGAETEFIVRLSTDVLAENRINSTPITLNVKQA